MSSPPPPPQHSDSRINMTGDRNVHVNEAANTTGASRSRRLQLRNAGFRGTAVVPTRKVTPRRSSTATSNTSLATWSSISGSPDRENCSPSGRAKGTAGNTNRKSSGGILQEISNSSLHRPKRATNRASASSSFAMETPPTVTREYDDSFPEYISSPAAQPAAGSIRMKPSKARRKVAPRRSISGETRKYVEHLETELVAAQAQLSSVTSPSTTREQTSRMRHLNAETRQLQTQLTEWETLFEERVQQEIDRHSEIEGELKAQIRDLEENAQEGLYKLQELETSLESANANFSITERANQNLEKRLEIMSELLATSPNKIDLHAQTKGGRRRQGRPKSMLPRFPTAGSLGVSPDRCSWTMPTSPTLSFPRTTYPPSARGSRDLGHQIAAMHQSEPTTDAESIFSMPSPGDSMTTVETAMDDFERGMPHFDLPSFAAAQGVKPRTARRMRRFGAGCMGPRPLILPSSKYCDQIPASAPPYDRHESPPSFESLVMMPNQLRTPVIARRRASTQADSSTMARLVLTPLLTASEELGAGGESGLSFKSPPASEQTERDFSSLGNVAGRNLMDELSRLQRIDSGSSSTRPNTSYTEASGAQCSENNEEPTVLIESPTTRPSTGSDDGAPDYDEALLCPEDVEREFAAQQTDPTTRQDRQSSAKRIVEDRYFMSYFSRLRTLFADLWHSPLDLARHLVHTAQARVPTPECLRNVQWWLVGVLLGPMAKRRMMAQSFNRRLHSSKCTPLLAGACDDVDSDLGYGTAYETPLPSPSPVFPSSSSSALASGSSSRKRIAGQGKKRCPTGPGHNPQQQQQRAECPHLQTGLLAKHSPWIWLQFSLTLAFAVGTAFTKGPGTLMKNCGRECWCEGEHEMGAMTRRKSKSGLSGA